MSARDLEAATRTTREMGRKLAATRGTPNHNILQFTYTCPHAPTDRTPPPVLHAPAVNVTTVPMGRAC